MVATEHREVSIWKRYLRRAIRIAEECERVLEARSLPSEHDTFLFASLVRSRRLAEALAMLQAGNAYEARTIVRAMIESAKSTNESGSKIDVESTSRPMGVDSRAYIEGGFAQIELGHDRANPTRDRSLGTNHGE